MSLMKLISMLKIEIILPPMSDCGDCKKCDHFMINEIVKEKTGRIEVEKFRNKVKNLILREAEGKLRGSEKLQGEI